MTTFLIQRMGAGASAAHEQEISEHQEAYAESHAEPSSKLPSKFQLGDIVEISLPDNITMDGLVIEIIGTGKIRVECADRVHLCSVKDCALLKSADELEIGDKVEMQPPGSYLFFVGTVIVTNEDGTFDIKMNADGDDDDGEPDIETHVPRGLIRKIASNRLKGQFKKGGWAIVALNALAGPSRKLTIIPRATEEKTELEQADALPA